MADVRTLLTQAVEAIAAAQAAMDDDIEAAHDDLVAARLLIATALLELADGAHRD